MTVNINIELVSITHLDPLGISDHDVILWEIVTTVKKTENSPRYAYDFEEAKFHEFRIKLENHDWCTMYDIDINLVNEKCLKKP